MCLIRKIFSAIAPGKVSLPAGYCFFSFAPFVVSILSNRSKGNVKIMTGTCTCRCYTQMHQRLLFLTQGAAKNLPELARTSEPARRLEATSWPFTTVADDLNWRRPRANPAWHVGRVGLKPGTAELRAQNADHSAALPPPEASMRGARQNA